MDIRCDIRSTRAGGEMLEESDEGEFKERGYTQRTHLASRRGVQSFASPNAPSLLSFSSSTILASCPSESMPS